MVIIDSLNGYSKTMQSGTILELQLHEMLSYLGQLGVVTIMVLAQAQNPGSVPVESGRRLRKRDEPFFPRRRRDFLGGF
jgi:hypothetical protein